MREDLLKELKQMILSKIGVDFTDPCNVFFKPYEVDEDDPFEEDMEPQEVFNKDGVIAVIEWELGDVFIDGLRISEQTYLRAGHPDID